MPVRIFGVHEHIEILRLEVGGVAHMNVHIEILHGIGDVNRESQRFPDIPLLFRKGLDVTIIDVLVARGAKQDNSE